MIALRAIVTAPTLALSVGSVDFGTVRVGAGLISYVQLENPSPVPAEWDIRKPVESDRDSQRFIVTPRSGVVLPGQRENVAIEFRPLAAESYTAKLPLRVANSLRTYAISVRGTGSAPLISFSPSEIEAGPVLPGSDGEVVQVCIKNDGEEAVELFCVDFDKQHVEEVS